MLLLARYWREAAILGLLVALAAAGLTFTHHERQVGATAVLRSDTKATAAVRAHADAETEANVVKSAMAEQGARSAQNAVDAYMAAHPVGVIRVSEPAGDRGAGVCQTRGDAGGAARAGAGPAVVSAVLGGGEDSDLGPALTEILSSASRLAALERERQAR